MEKDADQEALLDLWEEFASGLDKKLKIKGSPHKLWSEALFRVGRRQIERRNFGKAETIIRTLGRSASGKALKEMIGEATQS